MSLLRTEPSRVPFSQAVLPSLKRVISHTLRCLCLTRAYYVLPLKQHIYIFTQAFRKLLPCLCWPRGGFANNYRWDAGSYKGALAHPGGLQSLHPPCSFLTWAPRPTLTLPSVALSLTYFSPACPPPSQALWPLCATVSSSVKQA